MNTGEGTILWQVNFLYNIYKGFSKGKSQHGRVRNHNDSVRTVRKCAPNNLVRTWTGSCVVDRDDAETVLCVPLEVVKRVGCTDDVHLILGRCVAEIIIVDLVACDGECRWIVTRALPWQTDGRRRDDSGIEAHRRIRDLSWLRKIYVIDIIEMYEIMALFHLVAVISSDKFRQKLWPVDKSPCWYDSITAGDQSVILKEVREILCKYLKYWSLVTVALQNQYYIV